MAITHEPDKYEGVLLVSGDGLVNQFVNGLMERQDEDDDNDDGQSGLLLCCL